mmetsp:Transcript_19559/g.58018  ORF Transcript_19559/g.58018 Transcript_19559/m.58018 type:complete len:653 (-) Transcript_19559:811-2769(-)|eukprot:363053-Chlamydomonas_euryale.AAC.3
MASRLSCGEGSGCTHPETTAVVLELQARSSRTLAAKAPPRSAYEHDNDDNDDAAEALLALQGMSAGSPVQGTPLARSPGGPGHMCRGANGSFKRLASGTSSPTAMESHPCDTLGEAHAKPFHRMSAIDLGDACGSSGSAEDKYSEQQVGPEPDLLLDMQITVEPGNDKGCQVWFPPLSDDELRKRGLYHHLAHGGLAAAAADAGDAGEAAAPAGGCSRGDAMAPAADAGDRKRKLSDSGMFSAFAATKPQYGSRLTLRDNVQSPGHVTNSPKDTMSGGGVGDVAGSQKRPRFIWTDELHRRFVHVVNQLGVKTAVPKAILQMLNVEGMTRENVASHLQKYRMAIKRNGGSGVCAGAPGDVAATESASHTVSEAAGDAAVAVAATLATSQSAPTPPSAPPPKRRQPSPTASPPAAPQQPAAAAVEAVHVKAEEWDTQAATPLRARTVQTAHATAAPPQVLQLQQQQPEALRLAHGQEAMPGSEQAPRLAADCGHANVSSMSFVGLRGGGANMGGGAYAGSHAMQPAAAAAVESDAGRSMPRGLVSQLLLQQQQSHRQQAVPLMSEASPTPGGRVVGGSPVLGSGQVMGNAQVLQMLHSNAVNAQPTHLPSNGGSPNVVMTLPLSVLQGLIGTSGNNIVLLPTNGALAPNAANI